MRRTHNDDGPMVHAAPSISDLLDKVHELRHQCHVKVRRAVERHVLALHQDEVDRIMNQLANDNVL